MNSGMSLGSLIYQLDAYIALLPQIRAYKCVYTISIGKPNRLHLHDQVADATETPIYSDLEHNALALNIKSW